MRGAIVLIFLAGLSEGLGTQSIVLFANAVAPGSLLVRPATVPPP